MSVWDRPEPSPSPAPLDKQQIVAAAIALADEGGLAEVSLRKVAARLGAGPMRLYRYISSKEDLLDLMVDEIQVEILAGQQHRDWRDGLRAYAQRVRQTALRHEWFADLLGNRPTLGPNSLAVGEMTLATIDGLSDIDTVMRAVETLNAYLTGAVRREIANRRAERTTGLSREEWQHSRGPHLTTMLASGRFPTVAKMVHDGTDLAAEETFATGLEWILDAVAAKFNQSTR